MEYFEFLGISISDHLSVEEKLHKVIQHYIIIEHNKNKLKNRKLCDF